MLLKAEFEADMSFLEPSIEAMIGAGEGKILIFCQCASSIRPFIHPSVCLFIHLTVHPYM